jgi:hypothetical protein
MKRRRIAPRYQLSVIGGSCRVKGSASRDGAWRIQNGFIFFQNDKANFIAAREIVIEFVF